MIDPIHPNTMNSCLSMIKLLNKKRKGTNTQDFLTMKKAYKIELLSILKQNCEKFIAFPDDMNYDLFLHYITAEPTIDILDIEFDFLLS